MVNRKVTKAVKNMTLRQLMVNIDVDRLEGADVVTGFSYDLTIEEYLENFLKRNPNYVENQVKMREYLKGFKQ